MDGLCLDYGISFCVSIFHYYAAMCHYLDGTTSTVTVDVIVYVTLAVFVFVILKCLQVAVKVSLSNPSEFQLLGSSSKRTMCATSSNTAAENAGKSVAIFLFFDVSLNTRVHFGWYLRYTIMKGAVRL